MKLLLKVGLLLAHVEAIAVVRSFKINTDALWKQLKDYADTSKVVSAAKLDEAYAAKDRYGQSLPLPPRDVLMKQADTNKDGALSKEEMSAWKGYEGKFRCRNPGDSLYGCEERCVAGIDKINGDGSYFQYPANNEGEFDDDDIQINTRAKYTGGITRAQRMVIQRGVLDTVKRKVEGAFVEFGAKDLHSWRLIFDSLSAAGANRTELRVYDTFRGFDECDHSKDTGMCPVVGSSAPMFDALQADIQKFGDVTRTKIHRVDFSNMHAKDLPSKVAFALVDGSLYPTVKAMLKALHPTLSMGATVFIHDFGWEGFPGVEEAVKDYLHKEGRGQSIVLPGGPDGVACYLGQMTIV